MVTAEKCQPKQLLLPFLFWEGGYQASFWSAREVEESIAVRQRSTSEQPSSLPRIATSTPIMSAPLVIPTTLLSGLQSLDYN